MFGLIFANIRRFYMSDSSTKLITIFVVSFTKIWNSGGWKINIDILNTIYILIKIIVINIIWTWNSKITYYLLYVKKTQTI